MALIKCPECLHEVSEYAASCPNCVYTINNKHEESHAINKMKSNSIPKFLICVFLLFIFVSLIFLSQAVSSKTEIVESIDRTEAVITALESPFSDASYYEIEEYEENLEYYESELAKEQTKFNLSLVVIIISSISICICFIVIKNNKINNSK